MKIISANENEVTITLKDQEINYIHTGLYMYQRQLDNNNEMDALKKKEMVIELNNMIKLFDRLV